MSDGDERKEQVDVYLPPEMRDRIERELGYGDSVSAWIREAAKERLARVDNDDRECELTVTGAGSDD